MDIFVGVAVHQTCAWLLLYLTIGRLGIVPILTEKTIHLGLLTPQTGPWPIGKECVAAAELALEKVNFDPALSALRNGGYNFSLQTKDTECDLSQGLYQLVDLITMNNNDEAKKIDALIGPACDDVCETGALLTSNWEIPTISYGCRLTKLSNKTTYPFFVRTTATSDALYQFLKATLHHFGWDHVTFVSGAEKTWLEVDSLFEALLEEEEHISIYNLDMARLQTTTTALTNLKDAAAISRVFVLCAYSHDVGDFLLLAEELGLLNGHFVFVSLQASLASILSTQTESVLRQRLVKATEGLLDMSFAEPDDHLPYAKFKEQLINKIIEAGGVPNLTETDVISSMVYDGIYGYALALNDTIAAGYNVTNTKEIIQRLYPRKYEGVAGTVVLDENGERCLDFMLGNIHDGKYVRAAFFNSRTHELTFNPNVTLIWPGGSTRVPLGLPRCGWNGGLCIEEEMNVALIVGSVSGAVLILTIIIVTIVFATKNRKYQMEMMSLSWKINNAELKQGMRKAVNFGSSISRSTVDSMGKSMLSVGTEQGDNVSIMTNQVFTAVSSYGGLTVAIKPIQKLYVALTDDVIREVNSIRALRHVNINQLVGACVEPQKISLVSLYCHKGSLADVLENERIKLDWIFKISFASDIAKGMAFLHDSPVECHGRLKSSNVFIDSHWTCRIGDFAMPCFREGEKPTNNGKHAELYKVLWTAPEFLRTPIFDHAGTRKGDVYSFAIILQEIVTRTGPYGLASAEPEDIIERVKNGEHPRYRPFVPAEAADESVLDLMRICWEEIPAFRPNFVTIRDSLRKMNNGNTTNLVDQMIHMMEKYANNLEELVEERTTQLADEQKKTEELLCRMLPKSVADDLKRGKHIVPESFTSVTIFFSDIVGFTALASESSPLEVVDFLNDLYTCFDTVIDTYSVYKVETIGDAYMVVGGLPVKYINHAEEVATMALDLLSSVTKFRIRHRPDKQLQLRIGMHSGPVVAGVVGLKMPRYCLFGDTVNFASRLESSGLALRIHVSPDSKEHLDRTGVFQLTERGEISMKGKGIVKTFFLTGKDGFKKQLPDLSKAASLEEHTFK